MGTLDLSQVESAPTKVKLPDGRLYDMASPDQLGPLPLQRVMSRYRRAEELMAKTDADEADVEEMCELLTDVACVIIPQAPRDVVGSLSVPRLQRLVAAFSDASRATAPAGEAETSAS